MKLLVTGGAGYIGSHTTQALLNDGHQVVVYDNMSTGFSQAVPLGADLVQGDVRDIDNVGKVLRAHKIEGVLHFAAKLIVPESVRAPLDYYENNVYGTLRLLQACAAADVNRFIFSSTAAVYGEGSGKPLKETDLTLPINPYGNTKRVSEMMLQDWHQAQPDFKFVALRYFNVAGASMTTHNGQRTQQATHLIKVASEVATGKRASLEIFGTDYPTADGTCIRDYIHVDDLAAAHVAALKGLHAGHTGGIFNCGYGRGSSVREVINMVAQVSGKKLNVRESGRRAGDPASLTSDPALLRREFQWQPQYDSLEQICRSAYEWESKS